MSDDDEKPGFDVQVYDYDAEHEAFIALSFAPFPGLKIRVPFLEDDYATIDEVYWNDGNNCFVVYLCDCEGGVSHDQPNQQVG